MSDRLDEATAALRRETPDAPGELVDTVIRRVRRELRPGRTIELSTPTGTAGVTEAALRAALAAVLDEQGLVLVRSCRFTFASRVDVALTVAARWESYDQRAPEQVQRAVVTSLRRLFGVRVRRVDVEVQDVVTAVGA